MGVIRQLCTLHNYWNPGITQPSGTAQSRPFGGSDECYNFTSSGRFSDIIQKPFVPWQDPENKWREEKRRHGNRAMKGNVSTTSISSTTLRWNSYSSDHLFLIVTIMWQMWLSEISWSYRAFSHEMASMRGWAHDMASMLASAAGIACSRQYSTIVYVTCGLFVDMFKYISPKFLHLPSSSALVLSELCPMLLHTL